MTCNNRSVNTLAIRSDCISTADRIDTKTSNSASLVDQLLWLCGRAPILGIGNTSYLVDALRRRGLAAQGLLLVDEEPANSERDQTEHLRSGLLLALPFPDNAFRSIVCADGLECLTESEVPTALAELYRVSCRFVVLRISIDADFGHTTTVGARDRTWWENQCFAAGFRKHPLYYRQNDYQELEHDRTEIFIPLERIPGHVLHDLRSGDLEKEHLLHRDMLRESGRRSDAHCIRYYRAAELIRPGDAVLDLACGLGYGTHILWHNSQASHILAVDNSENSVRYASQCYAIDDRITFHVADAQTLDGIVDNSIDFVASFETIEHLPSPDRYLNSVFRVLKPGGRIMVSAPNNWADETGKDPNPYHFHVYTWERLRAEFGAHFLIEKGWIQTAGGAQRLHHSPREWSVVDTFSDLPHDAEWILLLGMKSPVGAESIPYTETLWEIPEDPEFHVAAFGRDYRNPWLVKAMVARGLRSECTVALAAIRAAVLDEAPPESVDYGAALCADIYAAIGSDSIDPDLYQIYTQRISNYTSIQDPSPHQLRWQISLLFAGAELAISCGLLDESKRLFLACAESDPTAYSPLLGIKVLDALFRLALYALGNDDYSEAKRLLHRSVADTKRFATGPWLNIVGSESAPIPFGLAELAQILDRGSRAAYLLSVLERGEGRYSAIEDESKGFYERQLLYLQGRLDAEQSRVGHLTHQVHVLETTAQNLAHEVETLGRVVQSEHTNSAALAQRLRNESENAQRLAEEARRESDNAQRLAEEVRRESENAHRFATDYRILQRKLAENRASPFVRLARWLDRLRK